MGSDLNRIKKVLKLDISEGNLFFIFSCSVTLDKNFDSTKLKMHLFLNMFEILCLELNVCK